MLWIDVKETISKNIGLEIGEDISEEDAQYLMDLGDRRDTFDSHDDDYFKLNDLLGSEVCDSEGFNDVEIYIKEED